MPRHVFDVHDELDSRDGEGIELPDLDAVRLEVRRTLPALPGDIETSQFRDDVRDTGGRRVVTSTVLMIMQTSSGDEPEKSLALAAKVSAAKVSAALGDESLGGGKNQPT